MVIGYDYEKRVYELLRSMVTFDEEIRFISFLEDHIPSFIFLIIYNKKEQQTHFKIYKLKKNAKFDHPLHKIEETKSFVAEKIIENMNKGHFKKKRKKSYDNMELIPTKHMVIKSNNHLKPLFTTNPVRSNSNLSGSQRSHTEVNIKSNHVNNNDDNNQSSDELFTKPAQPPFTTCEDLPQIELEMSPTAKKGDSQHFEEHPFFIDEFGKL